MKIKYRQMIIEQIENRTQNDFRRNKETYKVISKKIFGENTTIYIDDIENGDKYVIEIHFEDCNYYEIELTDGDTIEEIAENLLNNLILERFMNKQNPEVNWNNIRYMAKEER